MKRTAAFALACIMLASMLTGCSGKSTPASSEQPAQDANFLPDATAVAVLTAEPTSAPTATPEPVDLTNVPLNMIIDDIVVMEVEAVEPEADISTGETAAEEGEVVPRVLSAPSYTYSELSDTSFGFTFNYPSSWENLPGKHTVCFREIVDEGDFPARVAVTKKKLPHKPKAATITKQFQSYAKVIHSQYDSETFEFGELNETATFMGREAQEITYLAYSGDTEVAGYMVCCAIDYDLYVFHFCASYEDYSVMTSVLKRIRDSVKLVAPENEE